LPFFLSSLLLYHFFFSHRHHHCTTKDSPHIRRPHWQTKDDSLLGRDYEKDGETVAIFFFQVHSLSTVDSVALLKCTTTWPNLSTHHDWSFLHRWPAYPLLHSLAH
jgi:hypothetical protein